MDLPKCACGCGKLVRSTCRVFCHGHNPPWNKGKRFPGWVRKKLSAAHQGLKDSLTTREAKRKAQLRRWAKISKEDRVQHLAAARAAFAALPKSEQWRRMAKAWNTLGAQPKCKLRLAMEYARRFARRNPSLRETRFLDALEVLVGVKAHRQVWVNGFCLDGLIFDVNVEVDGCYWHSSQAIKAKDRRRDAVVRSIGLKIVRCDGDLAKVHAVASKTLHLVINGDSK